MLPLSAFTEYFLMWLKAGLDFLLCFFLKPMSLRASSCDAKEPFTEYFFGASICCLFGQPPVQHGLGFCLNLLGAKAIQIVYSISIEFISILFPRFVSFFDK